MSRKILHDQILCLWKFLDSFLHPHSVLLLCTHQHPESVYIFLHLLYGFFLWKPLSSKYQTLLTRVHSGFLSMPITIVVFNCF